jgi:hypothetical protein
MLNYQRVLWLGISKPSMRQNGMKDTEGPRIGWLCLRMGYTPPPNDGLINHWMECGTMLTNPVNSEVEGCNWNMCQLSGPNISFHCINLGANCAYSPASYHSSKVATRGRDQISPDHDPVKFIKYLPISIIPACVLVKSPCLMVKYTSSITSFLLQC